MSNAVTAWIAERHAGDRTAAMAAARRIVDRALDRVDDARWSGAERVAFGELALVLAQIPELSRWPAAEKRAVVHWMRAKGGNEFRFHAILARHRRLRDALASIAASDDVA